jgi:membrane protease YdiL (CAAX protease family)
VALLARPSLLPDGRDPTVRLVWLFVLLGLVGARWPTGPAAIAARPAPARVAVMALALGSFAFVVGRFATGGVSAAHPWFVRSLVLNALAAVAEEAFFRRLVFDLLSPYGPAAAVVGSAVLFAVVHVTVWGLWVLPLDVAAGLLLSWQRSVTGRWSVPAATHVLANALAIL